MKKKIVLSAIAAIFISGCSTMSVDKPLERRNQNKSTSVIYNDISNRAPLSRESDIINLNGADQYNPYSVTAKDVVVMDPFANTPIPGELRVSVDAAEFYGKKMGDIFNILTKNLQNTSLIYRPNVNPNLVVTLKTGKMQLFDLIKMISETMGYYAYYDSKLKAIVIDQFQTLKFYIPAGIFVKRDVSVKLGQDTGSASGEIDLNSDDVAKSFEDAFKELGSKNKIYNFNRDTGLLVVKEHPIYMDEIKTFVTDFVTDMSRSFLIEMAIVDVRLSSDRNRDIDLGKIFAQGKGWAVSAGGLFSGASSLIVNAASGVLDSAASEMPYRGLGKDGIKPSSSSVSVEGAIELLNAYTDSEVVEKGVSVVQNHSIKYIGNMSEMEYVSEITKTKGKDGNGDEFSIKKDTAKNGIQFVARVDGYKRKDFINVSIAPVLKYGIISTPTDVGNGNKVSNKTQQVREMLSTSSIKSGDMIIVGGLITHRDAYTSSQNPIFENWTPLGKKGSKKEKIETIFIVKVTEVTDPHQTYRIPTAEMSGGVLEKQGGM